MNAPSEKAEPAFIGVVCGLKSEADVVRQCAGRARPSDQPATAMRVGVSGASAQRAEEIARDFCRDGARAILSVGVSGGLNPALAPGDLLIADAVVTADGARYDCDKDIVKAIFRSLDAVSAPNPPTGAAAAPIILFGADEIVASAAEKAALFQRFNAAAVDMESHGAARAAASAGAAFAAVRAVADPASRALPSAALNAVAPDGSTRVMRTLLECAKAPGQFPALLKLGQDSGSALKTLRSVIGSIMDVL